MSRHIRVAWGCRHSWGGEERGILRGLRSLFWGGNGHRYDHCVIGFTFVYIHIYVYVPLGTCILYLSMSKMYPVNIRGLFYATYTSIKL